MSLVAKNPKAFHKYEILEKVEAGLMLVGPEVKSVRAGHVSIAEAYAVIRKGEAWLIGMTIQPYGPASLRNVEAARTRKLLLKRRQIESLAASVSRKGNTIVPLSLYFKDGWAKVELGLGRGKTAYDKRQSIRKREQDREIKRATSRRG